MSELPPRLQASLLLEKTTLESQLDGMISEYDDFAAKNKECIESERTQEPDCIEIRIKFNTLKEQVSLIDGQIKAIEKRLRMI